MYNANDAKTFLKHFSDCLFYFCSTSAAALLRLCVCVDIDCITIVWLRWKLVQLNSRRLQLVLTREFVIKVFFLFSMCKTVFSCIVHCINCLSNDVTCVWLAEVVMKIRHIWVQHAVVYGIYYWFLGTDKSLRGWWNGAVVWAVPYVTCIRSITWWT